MSHWGRGEQGLVWWRWAVRPWRSVGLISALIASFALPAFMAASADVFLVTASDSITRQILDENPTGIDVTVTATGRLDDERGRRARHRHAGRDRSGRSSRRPGTNDLRRPVLPGTRRRRHIASSGHHRLGGQVHRPRRCHRRARRRSRATGPSRAPGSPQRVSDQLDLQAGSLVSVAGSDPFPIAGVFANLWEGEPDPYWDDVPAPFVPRFSPVLSGPLFEIVVVPESVFFGLDVDGIVRWDSAATDLPDTYAGLIAQASRTRRLERSYTESPEMVDALAAFSGAGGPVPILATDVIDLRRDTRSIVAELDQPIATASIGGIVLGLIVTGGGSGVRRAKAGDRGPPAACRR